MNVMLHRLGSAFAALALMAASVSAAPRTYSLLVDGLVCPLCAYSVKRNVRTIKGVDAIEIDYRTGRAIITVAEGATLNEAAVREAVEKAGFKLRSFEEQQGSPQE